MEKEIQVFSPSMMDRIVNLVRNFEGVDIQALIAMVGKEDQSNRIQIMVTGPASGGYYPGVVVIKPSLADDFQKIGDDGSVRVKSNSGELTEDEVYDCHFIGTTNDYYILYETLRTGGGGSGGDGGCCCSDSNLEYHPTSAPFTTTFEIRRPFGTGSATTSNLDCSYFGDFAASRQAVDLPDWTHVLICDKTVDIRDSLTRLVGNNGLTYGDGDEVRIPSGATSPRFVVVCVETVNKGETGPDLYEYKRVFMMRHTA